MGTKVTISPYITKYFSHHVKKLYFPFAFRLLICNFAHKYIKTMKQYLDILDRILKEGAHAESL